MYDLFSAIISKVNSAVKSVGGKTPDDSGNVAVSYNDLNDVPSAFTPTSHTHSLDDINIALDQSLIFEHDDMDVSSDTSVTASTQQTLITFTADTHGDGSYVMYGYDTYEVEINIAMNAADKATAGVAAIRFVCDECDESTYDGTNMLENRMIIPFTPKLYSMSKIRTRMYVPSDIKTMSITAQTNINAVYHGCSIKIWKDSIA